jgi:mRNA-degrading endonuclease RelE of RelBE toxin-antitoxin system
MIPYEFTAHAERQLRKLPPPIQRQILRKLDYFLSTPEPLHFAEPLVGRQGHVYRFRFTDYRVIFEFVHGKMLITAVGRRDKIY